MESQVRQRFMRFTLIRAHALRVVDVANVHALIGQELKSAETNRKLVPEKDEWMYGGDLPCMQTARNEADKGIARLKELESAAYKGLVNTLKRGA